MRVHLFLMAVGVVVALLSSENVAVATTATERSEVPTAISTIEALQTQRLLRSNKDDEERIISAGPFEVIAKYWAKWRLESTISSRVNEYLESNIMPWMLFRNLKLSTKPRDHVDWIVYSRFKVQYKLNHPKKFA